jgi:hypothetical protein
MTRKRRVLLVGFGGFAMFGAGGFLGFRPTWNTATPSEIDRVIDPELRRPIAVFPDRRARYDRLIALLKEIDYSMIRRPGHSVWSTVSVTTAGPEFEVRNEKALAKLDALLEEGPVQGPVPHVLFDSRFREVARYKEVIRALVASAQGHADAGRVPLCVKAMDRANRLANRAYEGSQCVYDLLLGEAMRSTVASGACVLAENGKLSADGLKQVLAVLGPPPKDSKRLRECVRNEFQGYVYPLLPNPEVILRGNRNATLGLFEPSKDLSDYIVGNYDAVETARDTSQVYMACLQNLDRKPLLMDLTAEQHAGELAGELPEDASGPGDTLRNRWEGFRYRYQMSRIPNSFGRSLYTSFLGSQILWECRGRDETVGQLVRTELALTIYDREHKRLPTKLSELVSDGLLASMPTDPFDGEPLRYDPVKRRIWSVGRDLKDDHGRNNGFRRPLADDFVAPIP